MIINKNALHFRRIPSSCKVVFFSRDPNPDPYQIGKSNPDPGRYQSEKYVDPDPYQNCLDLQHCFCQKGHHCTIFFKCLNTGPYKVF
jgi:hypothetical protein